MSKKYFINNLDTAFGQVLLQELVKQPTEDPLHMCTVRVPLDAKPNGIKKILKRQKPKLFRKKAIDECQVYVYNLNQTQISDIQFGIQTMNKPFEDNKVFILVSDLMAWSNSGRKEKKQQKPSAEQGGEQGEPKEPKEQEENKEGSQEGKQDKQQDQVVQKQQEEEKPIQYTYFEDTDYEMRVPLQTYTYIKEIEQKVLAIKKQNVKVFIVCPGMVYGCGEDILFPLYKAAWLQYPKQLPYLGQGNNLVPMIHLKDLVKFVIRVAENPPQSPPYLLAFDQNSDRTQKGIIESISKGIGSGEITSVSQSNLIENPDRFQINIDIKPSKFLVGTAEQPSDFEWTAKQGISKNIQKTRQEFCQKHSLRPMKIVIVQNDLDWKTESKIDNILQTFSDYYKIPFLEIKDILTKANDFGDQQLKQDLSQQWTKINQYLLKGEVQRLDETMKVFYRAIRWRLSQNDCMNRGFVLLNFPNFKQELNYIFLKLSKNKLKRKKAKPKAQPKKPTQGQEGAQGEAPPEQQEQKNQEQAEEEQQQQGEGPKYELSYPQSVISIRKIGSNAAEQVIQFFTERGTQQLIYDTTGAKSHEIFQSLRSYIERNGRPNNYLVEEEQLLNKHLSFTDEENTISLANRQEQKKKDQQQVKQVEDARNKIRDKVAQQVRTQGEQQIKKMPFRNYLMEFVVPTLNQGLLEVSNIIPNDPVDLLAQYLYQKSYDF